MRCFLLNCSGVADGKEERPEGSEQQEEEHEEQGVRPTQDGQEVQPTVSRQRPRPETLHHYGETPRGTLTTCSVRHLYSAILESQTNLRRSPPCHHEYQRVDVCCRFSSLCVSTRRRLRPSCLRSMTRILWSSMT